MVMLNAGPAPVADLPPGLTTPAAPPRRAANDFRVLMVEDDPRDARLTEIGLNESGDIVAALFHATDLASAVETARQEVPDVVLLDLGLPDSQGLATLRDFVAQVPEIPVVVLTHLADDDVAAEALEQGAQDYLIKGRLQGELLRRILRFAVERHGLISLLAQRTG